MFTYELAPIFCRGYGRYRFPASHRRGRGRLVRGQVGTNHMTMLYLGDVKRKAGVRSTLSADTTRKPVA